MRRRSLPVAASPPAEIHGATPAGALRPSGSLLSTALGTCDNGPGVYTPGPPFRAIARESAPAHSPCYARTTFPAFPVRMPPQISSVRVRSSPEYRLAASQDRAGPATRVVSTVRWSRVPPSPSAG